MLVYCRFVVIMNMYYSIYSIYIYTCALYKQYSEISTSMIMYDYLQSEGFDSGSSMVYSPNGQSVCIAY
jgi:hypothetical protein